MSRTSSKRALEQALASLVPSGGKLHRAVASQIDAVLPLRVRPSVTPVCVAKGVAHSWLAIVPGLPERGLYGYRCYTGHDKTTDPDGALSLQFARSEQAWLIQLHRSWKRQAQSAKKRGAA